MYIPYHRNSKSLAMKNAGMAPKEKRKKEKITIFPEKFNWMSGFVLFSPKFPSHTLNILYILITYVWIEGRTITVIIQTLSSPLNTRAGLFREE